MRLQNANGALPKYQCGFCKGFCNKHALLGIIEKMKTARDSKEFCAAITDLSKAFDCICHDHCLIACLWTRSKRA